MANVICHICLRTDITAVNIATELFHFIEELCEYNIIENPRYQYCTICAHLLKKFYNFKQRCLKACKILKSYKGRSKIPKNLHEQIPSSMGLSSSLAPYKLLEHQHHTDADLLETKLDLNSEPNITSNNVKVHNKLKIEFTNPTPPVHIQVKEEPMCEIPDSDIETMQEADGENIYNIKSDGNLTPQSNFEENTKIKLEANKKELNTDGTNIDGSQDNAKKSRIKDFLRSFSEEIQNFEDDSVKVTSDDEDMEIKDTAFMLNNDPLKDDDSLNSMDDMESDIDDCDVESPPMDEQNAKSDSDSLSDIIEEAKNKKIDVNEIEDLKLAKTLLKIDKRNILLKRRVRFLKNKAKFKECILKWFENDEYDLGDGVKINKELFLKIYERCQKSYYNFKDTSDKNKTVEFLRTLYNMYNPEYETVFDIEYLNTEEKKIQEFKRRKDSPEYQNAPYQCARCYMGFHREWLHDSHMKKHDESSGPHECHICAVRFMSAAKRSEHANHCHSAVYVCRLCHVTFYYFASMQNHFNLHKGKEFPCPICNGIYRTATGLANHKRTHVTSHICTTCARSFVSAHGLVTHRRRKHEGAQEPSLSDAVRCAECSLTLDSRKAYERHLKISHRTRRYNCFRCRKRFLSMAELRQHNLEEPHQHSYKKPREELPIKEYKSAMLKHYQERRPDVPYQGGSATDRRLLCDQCGKKFLKYSVFLDHKNTHSGARPYQCPECPCKFATAAYLRCHTDRHGPPTQQCKFCGKLFTAASNLSFHMRIHINDRRFKCEACSASFLNNGALREHIRGVHQKLRRVKKINKLKDK